MCPEKSAGEGEKERGMRQLEDDDDVHYPSRFGERVRRTGKAFSYTFWRTQIEGEVFWSVQGPRGTGTGTETVWIATKHLGPAEHGDKFLQEVVLVHPTEAKVKIGYRAACSGGEGRIDVSKCIVEQFKRAGANTFDFDFRIVRRKRTPYPVRMGA